MRIKAEFFTWSNKNPLVHFFVPFCIILLISRHYFPKNFCAVLMLCCREVSARKPPVYGESADHSSHGSKLQPKLTRDLRSGSIFVSAVAVGENVGEPLKLGLISGYLRVFSFFHKHGVMGSSFNVLTQSLAVLGQPMQNFTEPLFRHILVHFSAPGAPESNCSGLPTA